MTVGPGVMAIIRETSPKRVWVPLYVAKVIFQSHAHVFSTRPIPFSIAVGLLYTATVFPVLAPLPPSLAGQALAFLVFVRNFGNILGITIGSYVPFVPGRGTILTKYCDARLYGTYKRAG